MMQEISPLPLGRGYPPLPKRLVSMLGQRPNVAADEGTEVHAVSVQSLLSVQPSVLALIHCLAVCGMLA
jgi:hypothetical protein